MKGLSKQGVMVAVFFAASSVAGGALAAGGSPDPMPPWPTDPMIDKVTALTKNNDWQGAAAVMKDALARSPQNAEYHNMYAYTTRKGPNPDMDLVFKHYNEALRIQPEYRGAHEYIGEAYLMTGNLAKAKEHLSTLDRLCTFGCEEYTMLKRAVAEYESRRK